MGKTGVCTLELGQAILMGQVWEPRFDLLHDGCATLGRSLTLSEHRLPCGRVKGIQKRVPHNGTVILNRPRGSQTSLCALTFVMGFSKAQVRRHGVRACPAAPRPHTLCLYHPLAQLQGEVFSLKGVPHSHNPFPPAQGALLGAWPPEASISLTKAPPRSSPQSTECRWELLPCGPCPGTS